MRLLARILAWLFLASAAAGACVYAVGRALTDTFEWSQFLYWIPGWALALAGIGAWLPGITLAWLGRRGRAGPQGELTPRARRGTAFGRLTRTGIGIGLVACLLGEAWHARLHRAVLPGPAKAEGPTLRVLHWNAMAPDVVPKDDTLAPLLSEYDPDLVLLTMALAPHQYDGLVSKLPEGYDGVHAGLFTLVSRLRVVSTRLYSLGLAGPIVPGSKWNPADPTSQPPSPDETHHWMEYVYNAVGPRIGLPHRYFRNADPGSLCVLTLDGTERYGREITVYFIDLPSDPLRPKNALGAQVAARLKEIMSQGGSGPAKPDLLMGDFNIPRGSTSLRTISGGMASAYDDAGVGVFATWPRVHPVLHLDQVFRSEGWRAKRYERFDPGSGDHMGEFVVVEQVGDRGRR